MAELGEEKIDIINYSEDPAEYIASALSPTKVVSVKLDEENKKALVKVPEDQLSLAIGKAGQNVRLAARLTGWKIDINGEKIEGASAEEASTEQESENTAEATEDAAVSEESQG
jgi:N utilization substance protein A